MKEQKKHVGRPTNEEVRERKNKKIIKTLVPIILILLVLGLCVLYRNNISNKLKGSVDKRLVKDFYYMSEFHTAERFGFKVSVTRKNGYIYLVDKSENKGRISIKDNNVSVYRYINKTNEFKLISKTYCKSNACKLKDNTSVKNIIIIVNTQYNDPIYVVGNKVYYSYEIEPLYSLKIKSGKLTFNESNSYFGSHWSVKTSDTNREWIDGRTGEVYSNKLAVKAGSTINIYANKKDLKYTDYGQYSSYNNVGVKIGANSILKTYKFKDGVIKYYVPTTASYIRFCAYDSMYNFKYKCYRVSVVGNTVKKSTTTIRRTEVK